MPDLDFSDAFIAAPIPKPAWRILEEEAERAELARRQQVIIMLPQKDDRTRHRKSQEHRLRSRSLHSMPLKSDTDTKEKK